MTWIKLFSSYQAIQPHKSCNVRIFTRQKLQNSSSIHWYTDDLVWDQIYSRFGIFYNILWKKLKGNIDEKHVERIWRNLAG